MSEALLILNYLREEVRERHARSAEKKACPTAGHEQSHKDDEIRQSV